MQDELIWKEDLVKAKEAKQWLSSNIPGVTSVEGPVQVFRSNDWGMTALFKVVKAGETKEVVLKVGFLPLFKTSPSIYEALESLHSKHVLSYIKGEVKGSQTWLLFEKFEGKQVRELNNPDLIYEMAGTMARLQSEFEKLDEPLKKGIPVYDYQELKHTLKTYIIKAMNEFAPVWKSDSLQLHKQFHLSLEDLEEISNPNHLMKMIELTQEICDELSIMDAPLSIYHIDFHTNNAVVTKEQEIMLYDFEEAVISNPFFSLDKLLNEVTKYEVESDEEYIYIQWTPAQRELRNAYLKECNHSSELLKLKMFDLAMMVSPLFYGYLGQFFLKQVGWEKSMPGLMAESFITANARMKRYKNRL
ncbi:phosphotransferase [Halobacillus litoralis]|uniref:phosphotransferase n=1 Tax=Halobacillus litoralis TaxID=45668 RepID=UPI001CFF3A56|nr:phosphotransferase [Halobacillus litoralis]